MGIELPNGKTARNIQEQVAFLTEKLKDLYAAFNELGIKKIEIVEELPEAGQEGILYLVPAEDPETGNYYEEYIWLDNEWELLGTTKIDLTNYCTLNTEQTITDVKTFAAEIKISDGTGTSSVINSIKTDQYGGMTFLRGGITAFGVGGTDVRFSNRHLLPNVGNTSYSLGANNSRWKDLLFNGIIDHISYNITWDNGILFKNSSNTTLFYIGSDRSVWTYGTIIPSPNSNLGNSTHVLGTVFTTNISDATNSATVADIAALIAYAKAQGWIS